MLDNKKSLNTDNAPTIHFKTVSLNINIFKKHKSPPYYILKKEADSLVLTFSATAT